MTKLKIEYYEALPKGPGLAKFNIVFDNGLVIRDAKLMRTNGDYWISYPSKEYTDKEGKKRFWNYISFKTRDEGAEFTAQVLEALKPFFTFEDQAQVIEEVPF